MSNLEFEKPYTLEQVVRQFAECVPEQEGLRVCQEVSVVGREAC